MENYEGLQFTEIKQQIADCCSFSLGQSIIMNTEPSFRKLAVQQALRRSDEALQLTIHYGPMPFGGIKDISYSVNLAMKDATLNCDDLLTIADQCYGIKNIKTYVSSAEGQYPEIRQLSDTLEDLEKVANSINRCISRSGEVADNASMALAKIRKQIKNLQSTITVRLAQFMARHSNYLQDDIVATRNDRSVILVKNSYKNTVEGLQYGTSASGGATYVEPNEIMPLNNELQFAKEEEKREVQRILFSLSQMVKNEGYRYLANTETLGLLDSIFAMAIWGRKHDAIIGKISEDMSLVIEKGRHPLIDARKVVANSYHIIPPVRTILITGPNTGGKTVSLKLVGLFTVMHLCGMPLPAESASIPLYDGVYYDIGDSQSIADDLSTFSAHIQKLAEICNKATDRSLVVLDELGSGTDPLEGQALASAILDYFRKKQIYCLASTHYSKLKAYGQQYDEIMLAAVEFDQVLLKPTYRYLENTIGSSNALEIASRYGLKEEIVSKAHEFKLQQQRPEDALMEKLQQQMELVSQQREALESQLEEVSKKQEELRKDKEKLEIDRRNILEEARNTAYEIVEEAREESNEIIDELKALKNYNIASVASLKHRLDEIVEEEEEEESDDEPLKVGDWVKITLTNQSGEIIAMDKKSVTVNCAGVKIKSSPGNLVKTTRPVIKSTVTRAKVNRTSSFKIECNLIGMRVEEALPVLNKFMDDAILANAPFVRIIHGIGSGILRKAVWEQLKKYKFVKKYELADGANGGSGATIVTLKGHDNA